SLAYDAHGRRPHLPSFPTRRSSDLSTSQPLAFAARYELYASVMPLSLRPRSALAKTTKACVLKEVDNLSDEMDKRRLEDEYESLAEGPTGRVGSGRNYHDSWAGGVVA